MQKLRLLLILGLVLTLLALTGSVVAQGGRPLAAALTGAAERPNPGDPDGSGTALITLNSGRGQVCFTLTAADITLPATGAHIHLGSADVAGPVVLGLTPPGDDGVSSGCVAASADLITDIRQNPSIYYVNIHTSDFRAGALRGQLAQTVRGPNDDLRSQNLKLTANLPQPDFTNSDLAFWGNLAFAGNYGGLRIIDITAPGKPQVLANLPCNGAQNDISVWNGLAVMSVDRPQDRLGCDSVNTPFGVPGFEGLRIFDVSDPANPHLITSVPTDCGSHTHTLLPDQDNDRLLIYVSSYPSSFLGPTPFGTQCSVPHSKISVVEVPLANPAAAQVIGQPTFALDPFFANGGSGCHDIQVFLELNIAAASCLSEAQLWDISNRTHPATTQRIDNPDVQIWHNAAFTWDGKVVAFGDEFGGGGAAGCKVDDPSTRGAVWFYAVDNPTTPLGHFKIPRPQDNTQNCTAHNFNVIPRNDRYILVSAWYQGGTSVVDFSDPANAREIAYYDAQLPVRANTWSSYWYNGLIYANDISRGVDVFLLSDSARAGAQRFDYLNPQTQESVLP